MKFKLTAKNFEITKELNNKLEKSLTKLKHALKSFETKGTPSYIILEKRPRKEEYKAKITFHLPKHTISTRDVGVSPEQALRRAADDARDRVIKVKDRLKDTHEISRRAKAQ